MEKRRLFILKTSYLFEPRFVQDQFFTLFEVEIFLTWIVPIFKQMEQTKLFIILFRNFKYSTNRVRTLETKFLPSKGLKLNY